VDCHPMKDEILTHTTKTGFEEKLDRRMGCIWDSGLLGCSQALFRAIFRDHQEGKESGTLATENGAATRNVAKKRDGSTETWWEEGLRSGGLEMGRLWGLRLGMHVAGGAGWWQPFLGDLMKEVLSQ